jgi:hypothetical protein
MTPGSPHLQRPPATPRVLALVGALLWGALECVALWRSGWARRPK